MKLVYVPFEEAIDGETYLTTTKYGWIEGIWDSSNKTCSRYYWHDMEWYPHALYKIEQIESRAGEVNLPYEPDSFTEEDLIRAIKKVKFEK